MASICEKLKSVPVERRLPPKRLLERASYAARATKSFGAQPYEAFERFLEKVARVREARGDGWRYETTAGAWDEQVHRLIGAPWPCKEAHRFEEIWRATMNDLAAQHLSVGRGAFGGWDDGDAALIRIAWCLTRHGRPERIVETGVARGLTTRALLEGLDRNGSGHLWSIDLPPLLEHEVAQQTAAAVPKRLYSRWTLVRGSSRRTLPGLVSGLGSLDLFVHDSMHTTRNVRFELAQVWPALVPGGVILIDDVEKNAATGQFLTAHPQTPSVISTSQDGRVLLCCLVKPRAAAGPGSEIGPPRGIPRTQPV
jgi:predicted O-methyltransferase YrrM